MTEEPTGFLYPFIEAEEHDAAALLSDLAGSAAAKAAESDRLRRDTLAAVGGVLDRAAAAVAERAGAGSRIFTFGNGGSATDAAVTAALFARPPTGIPLAARSLVAEPAVLSALGNDVGFELVFVRQLIAHATAGDVALGFSTSGSSANVLAAFGEARRRGMVTVGLAGYDGGQMAGSPDVEHCLVVRSDSVHRVQEVQAALCAELWRRVQHALTGAA